MKTVPPFPLARFGNPGALFRRRTIPDLLLSLGLGILSSGPLQGEVIVVPNQSAAQDGDTFTTTAAGDGGGGARSMLIFDASQFQPLTGPSYLTRFAWRPDTLPGPVGPRTTRLEIYASTTRRSLAEITTRMNDNVGPDRTLIFSGTHPFVSANQPGPGNTREFDYVFPVTTPFLYDPAAGNLVLDLQISGATGPAMRFDALTRSTVSLGLLGPDVATATTGLFVDVPVTQLTFEPAPIAEIRTSQVTVCWSSVPEATYRVEWRTEVSPAAWTVLVECVRSTGETTCVQDPLTPGDARRFYRIVRTNCTP